MADKSSADQLADALANDELEPDEVEDDAEVDDPDAEDDQSEEDAPDEEALSPAIKKILKTNRDAVRAAEKRARQAERALRGKPNDAEANAEVTAKADKFRGLLVKQATRSALLEAGLQGVPDRFVRMIDMDEIEVDEDGKIEGLDEQIDEIKQDFPEMFLAKETPRRRRTSGDGAPRQTSQTKKSSADILAERLVG